MHKILRLRKGVWRCKRLCLIMAAMTSKPDPGPSATCTPEDFARGFLDRWETLCLSGAEAACRLMSQSLDLARPSALKDPPAEKGDRLP